MISKDDFNRNEIFLVRECVYVEPERQLATVEMPINNNHGSEVNSYHDAQSMRNKFVTATQFISLMIS